VLVLTGAASASWSEPAGITGWRQVASVDGADTLVSTVWVKAAEPADLGGEVRVESDDYHKAMLTLAAYAGVDAGAVTAAGSADPVPTPEHASPSVAVAAGDWVASYWVDKSAATTTWSAPTDVVVRGTAIGQGTGRYSSLWADQGWAAAGLAGGGTASTDAESLGFGWTIALPAIDDGSSPPPAGGHVTKLLVIWEENDTTAVLDQMPYLNSLGETYGQATGYTGLVHPSEGNYVAAASGQGADTCGKRNPSPSACPQPGHTVFGQALAAGLTAKTYAESMTSNCLHANTGAYAVRHNPWPYFPAEASECAALDVPLGTTSAGALLTDTVQGTLPNAAMVVPDVDHDAHDGTPRQADDWLARWVPLLMAGPDYQAGRLAIVVTFDEGVGSDQNVPFVLVSPEQSGRVVAGAYDHYALSRLFSEVLGTEPLNAAADAPSLATAFGLR
jgi:acid phosphatase